MSKPIIFPTSGPGSGWNRPQNRAVPPDRGALAWDALPVLTAPVIFSGTWHCNGHRTAL